jgi:hypothetical protein
MNRLRVAIAAVAAMFALCAGMASVPAGAHDVRGGTLSISPGDTGWD